MSNKKKQNGRGRTPRRLAAVPAVAEPQRTSRETPPPEMLAEAFAEAVTSGYLDDHLQVLAVAVRRRVEQRRRGAEVAAAARLDVGDAVRFGPDVRPLYLRGRTAVVTGWAAKNVLVRLDDPVGRFADREISVPPLALVPLRPPHPTP